MQSLKNKAWFGCLGVLSLTFIVFYFYQPSNSSSVSQEDYAGKIAGLEAAQLEFVQPVHKNLPLLRGQNWDMFWPKNPEEEKVARRLSGFSLMDQNSKIVTEKSMQGNISVAGFFFASCSGFCPRLVQNVKKLQTAFGSDPQVKVIFHSVTPVQDTPPLLKEYAQKMDINSPYWHFLTGSKETIYRLARDIYQADTKADAQQGQNEFIHSENIYLMDHQLRFRGIYNGNSAAAMQDLIADIKLLKGELNDQQIKSI